MNAIRPAAIAILMCASLPAVAQQTDASADKQITAALSQISAEHIKAIDQKLVSFGTRNSLSSNDPDAATSPRGIIAARNWIKSEFERYSQECGGCLEVKLDTFTQPVGPRVPQPTEMSNVYAILRGTDPENDKRIYLVTGHYDSRNSDTLDAKGDAPGANDDASGTSVSIECARVLSKLKLPATIIFMAVPGEEQGLDGSKHFAHMAKEQGWDVTALNNDIVGGNKSPEQRTDVVRVFSEGIPSAATPADIRLIRATGAESDSASRELARYIAEVSRVYVHGFGPVLMFRPDRYLRGGDHFSFNEEGYPAVRFTEWREDFTRQHQTIRTENGIEYGDLPKWVDFDYVANVARVNAAALATLASAPAPPQNVRLLTKKLDNDTDLAWQPSPGGLATGYEVVWRETTAPEWQHSQALPKDATSAHLTLSKDNVVFGVRALGRNGLHSVAVAPVPER
jgi:hypothetical protein